MGSVKKYLYKGELPERESHHSRLFVDLAENIHIHVRQRLIVTTLEGPLFQKLALVVDNLIKK